MRRKEFWPLTKAKSLINKFIPQLCHEADGLIFQGAQVGLGPHPQPHGLAPVPGEPPPPCLAFNHQADCLQPVA